MLDGNHRPKVERVRRRPYFPEAKGQLLLDLLRQGDALRFQQDLLACRLHRAVTHPSHSTLTASHEISQLPTRSFCA